MNDVDWRDFSASALPPLLHAALQSFVHRGYHGTTTRQLAAEAGLSVPGLYHHYPSKQAILVTIVTASMQDLRRRSLAALEEAGDDPLRQLQLHTECMVLFHAHSKELAFLASSETRSIETPDHDRYLAMRDAQEQLLREIVQRGADSGVFSVPDPKATARALATLFTGIAQWFRTDGPRSAESIAAEYTEFAMRLVGAEGRRG